MENLHPSLQMRLDPPLQVGPTVLLESSHQGRIWPELLEGVEVFQRGAGRYSPPRKFLKFDALKCHFLHSEHYVYSLNLSSKYLFFGKN
jgi:hypothetical protein